MRLDISTSSMSSIRHLFLILVFFSVCSGVSLAREPPSLQTYIVHVNHPEGRVFSEDEDLQSWYRSFLPTTTVEGESESSSQQRILYSYQHVMSGFAARLTPDEVSAMKEKEGFVWAHPQRMHKLQTTHTPSFLGVQQQMGLWGRSILGKGVIVGVLDTGVLPDHPSFRGEGMPPPPAKWKGRCEFAASKCNNKLIGARSFDISAKALNGKEAASDPPIDEEGHGTHTASTAVGAFVMQAEALGNAKGTAVGIAPQAHLAIYKVCYGEDCSDADMLAGMDAAVADGVDVISMSIGGDSAPFFNDSIAVGTFAAIQKGIFVSCSAGNSGPSSYTLSNEAPWILTVGASTLDRKIVATAKLGNGMEFDGESLFQPYFSPKLLPLVYAGMNGKQESALCAAGSLKDLDVKGKVVLCLRGGGIARLAKGQEVKDAGGAAMILANQEPEGFSTIVDAHVLPATHVSFIDGQKIIAYINSTSTPSATIVFKGTVIGDSSAPAVTSFSSRGPSIASPGILKPDIIGPGVSVLAAWPFPLDNNTASTSTFNIISGTSMSCPHLSGIAALIKSAHPYWSPAAIKSAIMTTADQLNLAGKPIIEERLLPADIFTIGAGHVNPNKANDPGLVYDISPDNYIPYLCGLGYSDDQVGVLAHRRVKCSKISSIAEGQLNYPSFALALGPPPQTFTRTVTNVGEAYSTYDVTVVPPPGTYVTVKPSKLYFSKLNQKATYSVTFERNKSAYKSGEYTQGHLKWVSGKYSVRSPISVMFK